jgi:hypothetical protein
VNDVGAGGPLEIGEGRLLHIGTGILQAVFEVIPVLGAVVGEAEGEAVSAGSSGQRSNDTLLGPMLTEL